MKRRTIFSTLLFLCLGRAADPPFVIEPYLQMGDAPQLSSSDSILVMWHAADADERWDVQVKDPAHDKWSTPVSAAFTKVAVRDVDPHRVYSARLKNLTAGGEFSQDGREVDRFVVTR